MTAIHGRILAVYNEIVDHLKNDNFVSIYQLKELTLKKLCSLFVLNSSNPENDSNNAEASLQRFLITLLRSLTPEFLHYNSFLTLSSNNAFQTMINSSTGLPNLTQLNNAGGQNQSQTGMGIILGLGQSRATGQLIHIYPQLFLYLEFFKSVISADPQRDNAFNLRSVTRLLIHIDKLVH